MDALLRVHADRANCAVPCRQCGIRFLTHPRNAWRTDLRCPFGCRQHHRRQRAQQRCAAYRQTPQGQRRKKRLNGHRGVHGGKDSGESPAALSPSAAAESALDSCALTASEPPAFDSLLKTELHLEEIVLRESTVANSPMLPYAQLIVRLIEGIHLSLQELVAWLLRSMRQHSIASQRRGEYVLRFLHQHPP